MYTLCLSMTLFAFAPPGGQRGGGGDGGLQPIAAPGTTNSLALRIYVFPHAPARG